MSNLKNCSCAADSRVGTGIPLSKKTGGIFAAALASILLIISCGPSREELAFREDSKAISDSVSAYAPGIYTDSVNGIAHNFLRTADIKLRVKDVLDATNKIETMATQRFGYVSKSELSARENYSSTIKTKKDSLLEIKNYVTTSSIKLRIPSSELDTVLKQITAMALFVDYRTQTADDMKVKLFANSLSEKRLNTFGNRLEKKTNPQHKLDQIVQAEESVLEKQLLADSKRIESYEVADQVNFSTVTIELYQSQQVSSFLVPATPNVEPYEAPFLTLFAEAFMNGLGILEKIILFIVNTWGIICFALVIFLVAKKAKFLTAKKF
jgi:hypothetical protein